MIESHRSFHLFTQVLLSAVVFFFFHLKFPLIFQQKIKVFLVGGILIWYRIFLEDGFTEFDVHICCFPVAHS